MTIVNVIEQNNNSKYLIISQQKDPSTLITTRVAITDNANNLIKLVDIQRGPQGEQGPMGPAGPPGQNAISFELLPISSGGTNNTIFTNDKIIYYDGSKLSSTNYSINDLLAISNADAITGIITNTGLSKVTSGSTVTLNTNLGEGLTVDNNNNIIVDDTIARRVELTVGNISGILGISKGGTNNSVFNTNRLVYFDGSKLTSFPLDTGRIVTSGSSISIVAGSGLLGGGSISIPSGSVVINIGESSDILVAENSISLSITGIAGTYTKVTTDNKGRVVSGELLTQQDIIDILGYTPWHIGNDGQDSGLDADLLDGQQGSYYLNFSNFTGTIQTDVLPSNTIPGTYSKVTVNDKGLVLNGTGINYADVVTALGYRPVSVSGDVINGNLDIIGNVDISNGNLTLEDNLPIFAYDNASLLPNDPRGFSFVYGNTFKQTGILAYYPADNQLKLITDIFGTGTNDLGGGNSENNFNGEIDGGNSSSIYLLGNMQGDEAIVLLQHIADQRYVSLVANQIISGIKTFISPVNVYNYINVIQGTGYNGAPIFVGGNSGLVTNLNSDLLDNNHGSYYRNAVNLTGTLDYNNTTISNISGTTSYLSRFDSRTSGPSRTVSDSIVRQSGASNIIVENGSLAVGNNNNVQGLYSTAVGTSNIITTNNSLAVGSNNSVNANNSVAINNGSKTTEPNSLAMGSYGTTWLQNQISIGAFQELNPNDNITRIGLGQHSVAAIGYNGVTNGSYSSLSPTITIPNNKTILYNIDLLFTKLGGSGAAAFSFASGIIKNINGTSYLLQNHQKSELYNDSQIREYLYTIRVGSNTNQNQILSVLKPPLLNNSLQIQNLPSISRIRPNLSEISGYFYKTFDGRTVVQMNKPISSGSFTQNEDDYIIKIKSYNHGAVTGSIVNITYTSGIVVNPPDSGHIVKYVYNKDEFGVSDYFWIGHYKNGFIDILNNNISGIDNQFKTVFTGNVWNQSNTVLNCSPSIIGKISSGMPLSVVDGGFSGTPVVTSVSGSTLTLSVPYTGGLNNINKVFEFNQYSYYRFNSSKSVFIDDLVSNYNLAIDKTGEVVFTTSGIKIATSGFTGPVILSPILVSPTINNSGFLICTQKRSYDGRFNRSSAIFNPYYGTYIQYQSTNGSGNIDISTNSLISSFAPSYSPYVKFLTATNSFSGILTSGSNIITNCSPIQSGKIFSGMILSSSVSGFPIGNTVSISPTSNSITMSLPFSGITTTGLIVYSGEIPPENNYFKIQNLYNGSGVQVQRLYGNSSGAYLTGQAILYSDYGFADMSVNLFDIANMSEAELAYIRFRSNSNGLIPVSDNYRISGVSQSAFSIRTRHLMPDSGVFSTGLLTTTLDKDHGYVPPASMPNYLQQIPLVFSGPNNYVVVGGGATPSYTGTHPTNRIPKNSMFDVLAVTGDYLLINDNANYLIKESNSIPVFDIFQTASYTKNSGNNTLRVNFNKNYLQTNDQIYCIFNNVFGLDQNFRITGIDTNNNIYSIRPVSGSINGVSDSGSLSYIGSTSGFVYSPLNNIYFHSYGGRSESWGRDLNGKYVNPPLTGFFNIYNSPFLCESGTLCIHISGISNFASINAGDSFYFDFIDMPNTVLTGIFNINDKISSNILTLNIPYNSNYLNQSGLVYLIDSVENIKTNKHPNYNNVFSIGSLSASPSNIYKHQLSRYNEANNRWKHALSIQNNLSPNKYTETFSINRDNQNTSQQTRFIILTPEDLSCSIQYSIDDINYSPVNNDTVSINAGDSLRFKIIVKNGAGYWSTIINESAPRINILGISNYEIVDNEKVYNTSLNQWEIIVRCGTITRLVTNKNIKITVSDESARIYKDISLSVVQPLTSTSIGNVGYGYAGGGLYWRLLFEVYGGNLSEAQVPNIGLISQGYPEFATAYATVEYLGYPSGWYGVLIQGSPGPNSGIFNPVVAINDGSTTIYRTGTLIVRPGAGPIEPYSIVPRTFSNNIINKYLNTEFNDFGFIVPVETNTDANFNVLLTNTTALNINNPVIEYRPNLKVYTYRANISGNPGYYTPFVNINVSQPSGLSYGQYSLSTGINLTIYNNIFIDSSELIQPLEFDLNKDWSFDFYIKGGGSSYRENMPPKVYLSNTPNIGIYNINEGGPLEYRIGYNYDSINKYWKVSVTGKKDLFGENAVATGNYPISIYAEDDTGYINGTINTNITGNPYLININTNKYATPNNGFEFNVDIGGVRYPSTPSLSIPENLKEALIIPTRTYYKYDPDISIWEASYNCASITEKWDASVSLSNNNLSVRAKGILSDKLYVAGRITTVETENTLSVFKPLKIKGLNSSYEVFEGSPWEFTFRTEGGLEDSKYPPEIQLSNLPTPCTGYDPRIPDASNNSCFYSKQWDNNGKWWVYKFVGTPICLTQGEFNVEVFARDRINETTYGTDTASTRITYKTLGDHPGPSIESISDTRLYPNCLPYQSPNATYKINVRQTCPRPTGITGLIVWGALPPGLTFSDSRAGTYFAPYSDLTGGFITIQGYPTAFADGGQYPQRLNVAVVDARGKSGVLNNITFSDGSAPIEASPTDISIYFAQSGYQYTRSLGNDIIYNQNQHMPRPPASPFSMECLSILPHNKCLYSTGLYTIINNNDIRLSGYGTSLSIPWFKQLYNNQKIYVEFDNQVNSNLNKEYLITRINNDVISITNNNHNINPSISGVVKILKTEGNIQTLSVAGAVYGGTPTMSPIDTTTTGILGAGEFKSVNGTRGFVGRIKPSLIASLTSGIYRTNSTHLDDFTISTIDGENSQPHIIKFANCYETGYFRVSGIILPYPSLDSTDPPPGGGNNYSFNDGGAIAIAIRTAYGNTDIQKNNLLNARSLYINYEIFNITNNTELTSGNINTNNEGIGGTVFTPPNLSSGAIYSLYLQYLSNEEFPTYNRFAIPSLNNVYYWIHKGGSNTSVPTQLSFPPVVPVEDKSLLFISGINITTNNTMKLVGGYIPQNSFPFPSGGWNYADYPPHITGYIQQTIPQVKYTGTYIQPWYSSDVYLYIDNNPFISGNRVGIKFNSYPGYAALPFNSTGLRLTDVTGSVVLLRNAVTPTFSVKSGTIDVYDIFSISSGSISNQIKIIHRTGVADEFAVNKHIDLISLTNPNISVQGNIFPNKHRLTIISGSSTESYAAVGSLVFSGTLTNGSAVITNCSVNPLNILNTGIALYSPTNILPSNHVVSSITSNTITLSSNYTGATTNNVLIYYSGYNLNNYYSNLLDASGTGLCEARHNIYHSSNNLPQIAFSSGTNINANGQSTFAITGTPNVVGSYIYRVATSENSGLPLVTGITQWAPKKYGKDYPLTITTRPIIVAPSATVSLVNNSWTYSFAVTGGYVPRSDRFLEIELNGYIHTFNRTQTIVSNSGILFTLTSKPGFNWSGIFQSPVALKVYDETGFDLTYINAVY